MDYIFFPFSNKRRRNIRESYIDSDRVREKGVRGKQSFHDDEVFWIGKSLKCEIGMG